MKIIILALIDFLDLVHLLVELIKLVQQVINFKKPKVVLSF